LPGGKKRSGSTVGERSSSNSRKGGDHDVVGLCRRHLVDAGDVLLVQMLRIAADLLDLLALCGVDVGEARVVELHAAAVEVVDALRLRPVGARQVLPKEKGGASGSSASQGTAQHRLSPTTPSRKKARPPGVTF
jgi:hypothetical protein